MLIHLTQCIHISFELEFAGKALSATNCYKSYVYCILYAAFVCRILVLMLWIVHRCPVILWHSQSRRQLRSSEECGGTGWFPLRRSSGSHEHCHVHVSHGCVDMFAAEMMTIVRCSCKRKANKLHGQAFATGIRSQPCIQSSDVHFKLFISCSFSFKPRFQLFTCFGSVLCMPRNLVLTCWCDVVASTWKQPQEMTATKHLIL